MKVLVYADVEAGRPAAVARELVTGARALAGPGGRVDLALFGADPSAAADMGVDRILTLPALAAAPYDPAAHAAALSAAIAAAGPDLVLMGYTTAGLDLGPVVAIRHDLGLVSYCQTARAGDGAVDTESQIYGGKLIARAATPLPALLLMNVGAFAEAAPAPGQPEVVTLEAAAPQGLRFIDATAPDPDAVDITRADRLLCVGRGIGEADVIEEAQEVAGLMGAELVGSRPVVDAGWLPKERQVGKSGRRVKPALYLALGVSGAPEHIEGMGEAGLIVAINTDASAPIFDHAHYGATVDLTDFLPAFRAALEGR